MFCANYVLNNFLLFWKLAFFSLNLIRKEISVDFCNFFMFNNNNY